MGENMKVKVNDLQSLYNDKVGEIISYINSENFSCVFVKIEDYKIWFDISQIKIIEEDNNEQISDSIENSEEKSPQLYDS